jgi:hypothetical protein
VTIQPIAQIRDALPVGHEQTRRSRQHL